MLIIQLYAGENFALKQYYKLLSKDRFPHSVPPFYIAQEVHSKEASAYFSILSAYFPININNQVTVGTKTRSNIVRSELYGFFPRPIT